MSCLEATFDLLQGEGAVRQGVGGVFEDLIMIKANGKG
jgi:hypothetical protein